MLYRIILLLSFLILPEQVLSQDDRKTTTGKIEIITTSEEILGKELAANYEKILAPDEKIKWTMHVPETYDPLYPPGIIVHSSARNLAILPFGWNTVLKNKNLIWISLNKTGRPQQNKEMLLTVMSTAYVESIYKVNTNRIYISSLTESCIPSSATMQVYPTVFKGIIYNSCLPINWRNNIPNSIEEMKKNRYVFISSSNRELEREMRRIIRKYKDAGLENIELINLPQLRYGKNLDRRRLAQSIEFLDIRN